MSSDDVTYEVAKTRIGLIYYYADSTKERVRTVVRTGTGFKVTFDRTTGDSRRFSVHWDGEVAMYVQEDGDYTSYGYSGGTGGSLTYMAPDCHAARIWKVFYEACRTGHFPMQDPREFNTAVTVNPDGEWNVF